MNHINEKLIRISGKVAIPGHLKRGQDVEITLKGGVIQRIENDNQDGTYDVVFVIKPTEAEVK